jgi:hypothetical protein
MKNHLTTLAEYRNDENKPVKRKKRDPGIPNNTPTEPK